MSDTPKIEEIPLDLSNELICDTIGMYARDVLSPESYSIIHDTLKIREAHEQSMNSVYESLGRAMFNEILIKILRNEIEKDHLDTDEICIGDKTVKVPEGYVHAEGRYCRHEFDEVIVLSASGIDTTKANEKLLSKRLEFYELWLDKGDKVLK